MRERNCKNCKYGQWDYHKNHIEETSEACSLCVGYNNWKMIRQLTATERNASDE